MRNTNFRFTAVLMAAFAMVFCLAQPGHAYSVLSHQAIVDAGWDKSIKPVLLKRFRALSPEQLKEARAYAYGGSIIQDMGYYPFGNRFFTDLVHYCRSGDFVEALISESVDVNEYAFALGALAHYASDNDGHSIGTNRAVPIIFPKLRSKYGNLVTYEEKPSAHLAVEFSFDVLQVARAQYAPSAYHDFIGFKVSKPVLERAFKKTYGLELKDVFVNLDLAIGSYRKTVSTIIPEITKVAWEAKKKDIEKLTPGITAEKFIYRLSPADFEKEWGSQYEKPGPSAKVLASIVRVVPKVGPLKPLAFKSITPEAERLFVDSFENALGRYRTLLAQLNNGRLQLENTDFDTGRPTRAGEYRLADETYAGLLKELAEHDFAEATPELRRNILAFYKNLNAPIATKKDRSDWRDTLRALDRLKSIQVSNAGLRNQ